MCVCVCVYVPCFSFVYIPYKSILNYNERALLEGILVCKSHADEGNSLLVLENLVNFFCQGPPTMARCPLQKP